MGGYEFVPAFCFGAREPDYEPVEVVFDDERATLVSSRCDDVDATFVGVSDVVTAEPWLPFFH